MSKMAAPVGKIFQSTSRLVLRSNELLRTTTPLTWESRRWKNLKSAKRPKAPPVERERAWEPKKKQVAVQTTRKVDADFLKKRVLDDVWIREHYPPQTHSLTKAVSMHAELAQPAMTNNMDGYVYLDMVLDLTTKKKTKFVRNIGNMMFMPHFFHYGKPRRIMVISGSEENIQKAKEMGATFYGGEDLIKMIDNGAVLKDEFDYVIATTDLMKPINKLKYFFKDRLPQKPMGNLTEDVEEAYRLFERGVAYSLQLTTDEAVGKLRVPLGQLNLGEDAVLENAGAFIHHLCSFRPADLGPFITSAACTCPPSPEVFSVDLSEYLPAPGQPRLRKPAVETDSEHGQAAVAGTM